MHLLHLPPLLYALGIFLRGAWVAPKPSIESDLVRFTSLTSMIVVRMHTAKAEVIEKVVQGEGSATKNEETVICGYTCNLNYCNSKVT